MSTTSRSVGFTVWRSSFHPCSRRQLPRTDHLIMRYSTLRVPPHMVFAKIKLSTPSRSSCHPRRQRPLLDKGMRIRRTA
eukprot:5098599-Alexandrium_andersonii.AAC.1